MTERINFGHEHEHNPADLEKAGAERRAELKRQHEQAGEKSQESLEATARHEALEKAKSIEREKDTERTREQSPAERRNNGPISKYERDASFNETMQDIQTHMSPASRTFSKIIHNKAIEKASDIGASTVARPNALLAGAVFAFVLTLAVYLVAKNLGYSLSGFETIGAFLLGWVIGIVYDFLKVMVTGRKSARPLAKFYRHFPIGVFLISAQVKAVFRWPL